MTIERTTTGAGQDYADRVLHEAMRGATCGLDPDQAQEVASNTLAGLVKASAALAAADYAGEIAKEVTCPSCKTKHVVRMPQAPSEVARTMAHAGKAADVVVRLMEFATGRPDSRPDRGTDWLRGLTDEQVRIVQGWVEANGAQEPPAPREARR